jgi:hypothetical protein
VEGVFSLSISHAAWMLIHSITESVFFSHMHEYYHKYLSTDDVLLSRYPAKIQDTV